MANIFGLRRDDMSEDKISIPDRGAEVLMQVLVLAAAALAETESQKQLAVWLAEHDRRRGADSLGFCIAEMPWHAESFDADRRFMVRVTDAASQQNGWEHLNARPNIEHLMPMLGWFHKRFVRLRYEDVNPRALEFWLSDMEPDDPALNGFPRCKRHGIYLTWLGCPLCRI